MDKIEEILQQHNLRNTKLRKAVLTLFMHADQGLSHLDISRRLDVPFDRVTLFRTLHAFEESGILHKIIDLNGTAKYAYNLQGDLKEHSHAHFMCLSCEGVFCLDHIFPLNELKVPKGFSKQSIDVQIKGLCVQCRHIA